MLKEIFHDSCSKFRNYKDLYGKPCKRDLMAKIVFSNKCFQLLAAVAIVSTIENAIRLKILRLANFNTVFQLVLTKFFQSELFSCLA